MTMCRKKTLTCWTDQTCHACLRVFVRPWSTGDSLAGPDGCLTPAGRRGCNPSAQQGRIVAAAAGRLSHCGRPTKRTWKWLGHPTMWTVTPYGGHTIVLGPFNQTGFHFAMSLSPTCRTRQTVDGAGSGVEARLAVSAGSVI